MGYLMDGDTLLLEVTSGSQLVAWLREFQQQFGTQHRVLTFHSADASMTIGIASDFGFLNHLSSDWRQPAYAAVGNAAFGHLDAPVAFYFHTHRTEVASRYCLPFTTLLAVLADYVETGQRATVVEWEEV